MPRSLVVTLASLFALLTTSAPDARAKTSHAAWIQTNGPQGGRISDLAIDPVDLSNVYAVGSRDGIYRSANGGASWELTSYGLEIIEAIDVVAVDPNQSGVILVGSNNDLIRSADGGSTWSDVRTGLDDCTRWGDRIRFSPSESGVVYLGGHTHCDETGGTVYRSADGGLSWTDIGVGIGVPAGGGIEDISVGADGSLLVAVNDRALETWRGGRVYHSTDAGQNWQHIDYGGDAEDRFIWSVFQNPHSPGEMWITEAGLFNEDIDQPAIFRSTDGGDTWSPIVYDVPLDGTQLRTLAASSSGRVYIAGGGALAATDDIGASFSDVSLPGDVVRFDLHNLAVHPQLPDVLLLPTGAGGIAQSEDAGQSWELRNEGIIATNINLIATDPVDPGVVYAASAGGEGTFRSDDYGETWQYLNPGGIVHPWADELTVDPVVPDRVWFMSDVPFLHHSTDRGDSWTVLTKPYEPNGFSFFSPYALGGSNDPDIVYAVSNGFGIFKGERRGIDEWDWRFLRESEIDYSYSVAVAADDPNVIYSGYNRKPFETAAKIRASTDGGESWFTSLEIPGAEAFTSVAFDPTDASRAYAVSTGEAGGTLWVKDGIDWEILGRPFNFTTIHAWAVSPDGMTAYAGAWGGGTFRTRDGGASWDEIDAPEAFSAAALALDPSSPDIVYLADRTSPVLYRSDDGADSWTVHTDLGPTYRRLMSVTVDPSNPSRLYVSAMGRMGPASGSLYVLENGSATDVMNGLPRLPLNVTVDPTNTDRLFTVLHERGVYRSTDGGDSWSDISAESSGLPDSGFNGLILHPQDPSTLYLFGGCDVRFSTVESAGLDPDIVHGVHRSSDGGDTWTLINGGVLGEASGSVKSLAFDPEDFDRIVATAENGVYVSQDGGDSWTAVNGLEGITVAGITLVSSGQGMSRSAFSFTNGAGVYSGVFDGDSFTWDTEPGFRATVHFGQIVPDPQTPGTLYVTGYPGGTFKSTDGGMSWHEKNFGMASFAVDDPLRQGYYALSISPMDSDRLYLGLYGKGVYRSDNGAETWRPVYGSSATLRSARVSALASDPIDPDAAVVATDSGVYRTMDAGASWTPMDAGLVSTDIRTLRYDGSGDLYAGVRGYGLYRWNVGSWEPQNPVGNWGVSWPMWDDRPLYQYTSLLIHPTQPERMLLGTFPQGIYASGDGGELWRESNVGWTNDGVFSLVTHPDDPEIVYAGTYNGMNRSLDFGGKWEVWDEGMPGEQWVFSIDFDPQNPNVMYACSKNGENEGQGTEDFRGTVLKSHDGGATWIEIVSGIGREQEYYKIIADRFEPGTVYLAAQNDGMLISRDGGASWDHFNDGLTNPLPGTNGNNVTNTLGISADHAVLYFGSRGSGVYRRSVAPVPPVHALSAQASGGVTLNWQFDDLNGNIASYEIYRGISDIGGLGALSSVASIADGSAREWADPATDPDVSYYYAVTTVSTDGFENRRVDILGPVVYASGPPSDFNGDGSVGFADFLEFASRFGLHSGDAGFDSKYDLDGSGAVDFPDFLTFASVFGS